MAKIVLGIGTSHSPQLSVRASEWQVLREKDENDPRLDYQKLVQRAKPNLDSELTEEKFRQRDEACQKAIKTLGNALQKVNPDVVVVFGDDQHEQFQDGEHADLCHLSWQNLCLWSRIPAAIPRHGRRPKSVAGLKRRRNMRHARRWPII